MSTRLKNAALTAFVAIPLLASFARVVNYYPIPVWSLFSERGEVEKGSTHYTLFARTPDGTWTEIPPVRITDGLNGRHFMFAHYADTNLSFQIESPHPNNVRLACESGGVDQLPRGARVPDLLRAWGATYNRRLPSDSPYRFTALRLEARRWPGGQYSNFDAADYAWEVEV
jgi:hypothetical protein